MTIKELAKMLSNTCYCHICECGNPHTLLDIGSLKNITNSDLLDAKVIDFHSGDSCYCDAFITVEKQSNRYTLKEVIGILDPFERVNIYVVYSDCQKQKIVEDQLAFLIDEKYYGYLVENVELMLTEYNHMIVEIDVKLPNEE